MRTLTLPGTDIPVPNIVLGMMRIGHKTDAEVRRLVAAARDAGIDFFDHAAVYGDGPYLDFSHEHIVSSVEQSLRALQTDRVDILLLHRPDALVEPDELARAFDELEATGKVRAFGVSSHTPSQIDLLARSIRQPLAIATAWLTRHPAQLQVVLGTTDIQRIEDAAAGSGLRLTRAEWYELYRAAGHVLP